MTPSNLSLAETTRLWARIGILSFGGPAAQIALMHKEVVEERGWLTERQFMNALSFCMLLPGPEAMQLATYAGWRLQGTIGGLIAGLLFVIPGALIMLALSIIYALYGSVPIVDALFLGVKATVVIIVVEALLRVAKRALVHWDHWVLAAIAFIAIFFLAIPYPVIVIASAIYGYIRGHTGSDGKSEVVSKPEGIGAILKTASLWLLIWLVPIAGLVTVMPDSILADLGIFFSKLAVVTFGGAYAVLAYMAQDVVQSSGWLAAGEMLDGLGLAETTPGPLILVTQFVGFLAAYKQEGMGLAVVAAVITLWATFAPCFLWIFAGAPYIDWISTRPRLKGALTGITAAVVGVILNLSIWFALQVFFGQVDHVQSGWISTWIPELTTVDWQVVTLALISATLMFGFHMGIAKVLAIVAICSLIWSWIPAIG